MGHYITMFKWEFQTVLLNLFNKRDVYPYCLLLVEGMNIFSNKINKKQLAFLINLSWIPFVNFKDQELVLSFLSSTKIILGK